MDTTTLFLFEKIRRNEPFEYLELFNYLILIPLLTFVLKNANTYLTKISSYCQNKVSLIHSQKNILTLEALETLDKDGSTFYNYSRPILGLCSYLRKKGVKGNYKHVKCGNGTGKDFVIQNCSNLLLEKDIYLTVTEIQTEKSKENNQTIYRYVLESENNDIEKFLDECIREYIKGLSEVNNNKLYHYVYKGNDEFSRQVISDLVENPNLETFDKIYNEHSHQIMRDIQRLKNIDYYRRTGLKRKKGYLFFGAPGCGKTSTVMAMANYDNRHIIEVPLSRVKTNKEIEAILNLEHGWFEDYSKEKIIILFDEIDCNLKKIDNRNLEKIEIKNEIVTEDKKIYEEKRITDKTPIFSTLDQADLDLGTILSRLDGIGNYNGLIIVATTNHKDQLDPALYRELRLTPIQFDYCRKVDMIGMIESFYEMKLKESDKVKIPDRNAKISPAKFRCLLEKFEDDYKQLLSSFE